MIAYNTCIHEHLAGRGRGPGGSKSVEVVERVCHFIAAWTGKHVFPRSLTTLV